MSLKNCPFCGGEAEHEPVDIYGDEDSKRDTCTKCHATAPSEIWNTRAVLMMKPWEWVEAELVWGFWGGKFPRGKSYREQRYQSHVRNVVDDIWTAHANNVYLGRFASLELAKAACVEYVENKLKEWLV